MKIMFFKDIFAYNIYKCDINIDKYNIKIVLYIWR